MPTPYAKLLENLKAAQGDTAKLALVTFDFAVHNDPVLKAAAEAVAIPHWFNAITLAALMPEQADQADYLMNQLQALPMVESYITGNGEPAWNVHEATRLALRDRLLAHDPERFRQLSQRAADSYGTANPEAADLVLTSEHLYHQLAAQTEAGCAAFERVAGDWRGGFRIEPLQTLARLLEELLTAQPAPPMLPRGRGLAYQAIADARQNHQPAPVTQALLVKAGSIFRELVASDPANEDWKRDLSVSLHRLGILAVEKGDLAGALRSFTEGKNIIELLVGSNPANVGLQRDMIILLEGLGDTALAQGELRAATEYFEDCRDGWDKLIKQDPSNLGLQRGITVPLNRLGDLSVAQGDLAGALRYFKEDMAITEHLAASDPANAEWQRDLSVSLNRLGNLAVEQGDLAGALRSFTDAKDISERLAASDSANAAWQRDLFYSCYLIASKVFMHQERSAEALVLMEQSLGISESLAAADPTNVTWQNDARVSRRLVAELRAKIKS